MEQQTPAVCVTVGEALARYGFGQGHPFGPDRMAAFWSHMHAQGLDRRVNVMTPSQATTDEIGLFHTPEYIARVQRQSQTGEGFLDYGDTPAFSGVFEAAATVVGSVLRAADAMMDEACRRAFVPIAGLHHARREQAAGFCVFNDCGVLIEYLRRRHGLRRVLYVDIDAHHGDGVFYAFEDDPNVLCVDIHEDGHYLYPGTGAGSEAGRGAAAGTKLNLPLLPQADDTAFMQAWDQAELFLQRADFDFILLQCGADSLAGDPITHLRFSAEAHGHAAHRLCALAEEKCRGRLLGVGGGGYNRANLAAAWTRVVRAMLEAEA